MSDGGLDERIERLILELCTRRGSDKTVCPSEVARALSGVEWRSLMPAVRAAAGRLAAERRITVSQRGEPVETSHARGPIRLGLPGTPDHEGRCHRRN